MSAIELIALYKRLFYVSLGVAILGLVLAVFFFFFFDIRTVYALMTGKAKEKTVRRMAEQNAKTGNLRNQHIHTGPTGKTGKTGVKREVVPPPKQPEGQSAGAANGQTEQAVSETTVLQPEAAQTTVLQDNDQVGQTSILEKPETKGSYRFDVTENTLVIHTDEIIR